MKVRALFLLGLLAATSARADYKSTVLADNPPGYWRLDSLPPVVYSYAANLGAAGADANGVIGTFIREGQSGAIAGDTDKAMQFIGNGNSRVVVPFHPNLNQNSSFTFECWMKPNCPLGNAQALVVNRQGESGYTIYINGDGSFGFNMSRGGVGGFFWNSCVITNTPGQPTVGSSLVGKWTHVACVYDQSGGTTGLGIQFVYLNGVLAATKEITDQPWVPNPGPGSFNIGDRNYAGLLDEVAAYSVALDPAKVLAHYQAGVSGTGSYQATILADSPDGYWRLNETAGTVPAPVLAANLGTTGDAARGSYDLGLRLQQPGALVGSSDKAATFDGLKIVQVPPGPVSQRITPLSVEFWARPAIAYTGGTAQACVVSSTDRDFGRSGWLFYQGGNGWSWWFGTNTTTTYQIQLDPVMPITAGNWYHVVGTYDGTTARLYVNGAEIASKNGVGSPNWSKQFTIGGRYDYGIAGFQGSLDEVAIYATVLAPADILAHYQNGLSATPAQSYDSLVLAQNPLGYWRLNDASGVTYPGVQNYGYLGAAVDGTVIGTMSLNTDTPLVGDTNPSVDFTAGGRISIPFDPALNRTNTFSYEVWYKQTLGTGTSHRCPLWWRDEPVLGDTRGWVHYIVGEGNWFQSSDAYITWDGLGSNTLFAQDVWQHLVCTFDGKIKRIYLDGVLIAVSTNPKLAIKPVTRAVTTISSASYPWIGSLDEVAIYTNALPVERVQAHYVAARGANPPAVAPTFGVNAAGANSFEGATVTIPTIVLGTAPFAYQWYKGGSPVAGQTTDTLKLSPAKESDSGDYVLKVSNAGGQAESATATVTIQKAPPTIVGQPQSATRLQGSSVTFTVDAGGSQPLAYQWKSNNVDIAGANAASLTLNNIQPSFAADYKVYISNAAGNATSQAASLNVVAVAADSLAAAVVAAHPVAYWRLDEGAGAPVARDYVGGHDGPYDSTVVLAQPSAILGDTNPSATFSYGGIIVPFSADLNPYVTFSLEAWVKVDPNGAGTDRPILWSSTSYAGWAYGYVLAVNAGDVWAFTTGQKTSGFNTITGGNTASAGWYHVVCTFDDATGAKRLYVNNELVAQTTTATGTFAPNQTTPDNVAPFDQGIGWDVRNYTSFFGGLDEVAFYDYALTPEQVGAHYIVGATPTLGIGAAGNQVTVRWSVGKLLQSSDAASATWTEVPGATPPAYTVNAAPGTAQYYRVVYP
jgi:hypothetical protein